MKADHIIIDTASLINFFKYYHEFYHSHADKKRNMQKIFDGLEDFIIQNRILARKLRNFRYIFAKFGKKIGNFGKKKVFFGKKSAFQV